MIDAIKDNIGMLMAIFVSMITGIGIGAGITDMINNMKGEEDEKPGVQVLPVPSQVTRQLSHTCHPWP